jgi:hypothetical protein
MCVAFPKYQQPHGLSRGLPYIRVPRRRAPVLLGASLQAAQYRGRQGLKPSLLCTGVLRGRKQAWHTWPASLQGTSQRRCSGKLDRQWHGSRRRRREGRKVSGRHSPSSLIARPGQAGPHLLRGMATTGRSSRISVPAGRSRSASAWRPSLAENPRRKASCSAAASSAGSLANFCRRRGQAVASVPGGGGRQRRRQARQGQAVAASMVAICLARAPQLGGVLAQQSSRRQLITMAAHLAALLLLVG